MLPAAHGAQGQTMQLRTEDESSLCRRLRIYHTRTLVALLPGATHVYTGLMFSRARVGINVMVKIFRQHSPHATSACGAEQ